MADDGGAGFAEAVGTRLWDIAVQVKLQYPTLFAVIDKPGVWDVLLQAIQNNWPADRMKAALEATPYYQSTPIEQRQWDVLAATDPATAQERAGLASRQVEDVRKQLGISLSGAEGWGFAIRATVGGWDTNRLRYEMMIGRNPSGANPFEQTGGEFAKNAADVKSLADSFGIPLGDQGAIDWGRSITQGTATLDSIKGSYQAWASILYPALKDQFAMGRTLADFAQPYISLAQRELGVNTAQVQLSDPKWTNVFLRTDDKGQQIVRPMQEALSVLRTDPGFGYDASGPGTQAAAQMGTQLRQLMGVQA